MSTATVSTAVEGLKRVARMLEDGELSDDYQRDARKFRLCQMECKLAYNEFRWIAVEGNLFTILVSSVQAYQLLVVAESMCDRMAREYAPTKSGIDIGLRGYVEEMIRVTKLLVSHALEEGERARGMWSRKKSAEATEEEHDG